MSEKLVQVTSTDVLLDNDVRVTWQGFRPSDAESNKPSTYFITLTADGDPPTKISLIDLGAQSKDYEVELTLLHGTASIDGAAMGNKPVKVGPAGTGAPAQFEYSSASCTLQAKPIPPSGNVAAESGGAARMSGAGNPGDGGGPPPPYPGGGNNHN